MTTSTSTTHPTRAGFRERLHVLYGRLPALHCKGACWDSCSTTDGTALERALVADAGVALPPGVPHHLHLALIASGVHLRCPALGPLHNCTVYDERPLLCRSFGLMRAGACEHGCWAERFIELAELAELAEEIHALSREWEQAGRP
jgi:uncharacterized protein